MNEDKHIPVSHPWIAVDLDGTIMEDSHYPNFGPVRVDAKNYLWELKRSGLKIMIWTARTALLDFNGHYQNINKVVREIEEWCEKNNIPCDYVYPYPKPTFVVAFFDDRAINVGEDWNGKGQILSGWKRAFDKFVNKYGLSFSSNWEKKVLPPEVKK